jgi:Ca2+-binding EF-hand superfamily protein
MVTHPLFSSLALVLMISATSPATAADDRRDGRDGDRAGRGGSGMSMKRLDRDKNGSISKDEFLERTTSRFKDLDANKDGAVDTAEFEAPLLERAAYRVKRTLKKLDANADSKISSDEFLTGPRDRFNARDLNSDGKITEDDLPPGRKASRGWFGGKSEDQSDGKSRFYGRGKGERSLEDVTAKSAAEFAKIDANADGALDADELKKQASERIEFTKKRKLHTTDANNDGRLTEDEFTARSVKRFAELDLNSDGRLAEDDFGSTSSKWRFGK